jgi:hypothetical protein
MVIANVAGIMRRMDGEIHGCAITVRQFLRDRFKLTVWRNWKQADTVRAKIAEFFR